MISGIAPGCSSGVPPVSAFDQSPKMSIVPLARMRVFWCVKTSSPTWRRTLPTSAKTMPFGMLRSASGSFPGTVLSSSAKRTEPFLIR